jgi:hypothetical protein
MSSEQGFYELTQAYIKIAALEAQLKWKWRLFKTAPKDGSSIVVWREDAGVFTAAFLPSAGDPGEYGIPQYNGEECWFTPLGEDLSDDLPTLWQPLPGPPPGGSNG